MIFLLWICISASSDAIYRKFFNWIAVSGGLMAMLSISIFPEFSAVSTELKDSLIGFFVAFFVLLFFYQMKMMGAGDVKFAAVLGLWIGWKLLLPIWVLSCIFAVAHGIIANSLFKYRPDFYSYNRCFSDEKNKKFIPYVTYLSIATVLVLCFYKNQ